MNSILVLDDDLVAGVFELHSGNVVRRLDDLSECVRVDGRVERFQFERVDSLRVCYFSDDGVSDVPHGVYPVVLGYHSTWVSLIVLEEPLSRQVLSGLRLSIRRLDLSAGPVTSLGSLLPHSVATGRLAIDLVTTR